MTIIAYRDGVLASDTLVTVGSRRFSHIQKIHSLSGWLYAVAGSPASVMVVKNWIMAGANLDAKLDFDKSDCSAIVINNADGQTYFADETNQYFMREHQPFYALGSGASSAHGAMLMGATAIEAVNIAKKVDVYSGGATHFLKLNGEFNLEFDKEIYNTTD